MPKLPGSKETTLMRSAVRTLRSKCPSCGVPPGSSHKSSCKEKNLRQTLKVPPRAVPEMPESLKIPKGQMWVRWICESCRREGLFTVPKNCNGTWPFDITLGLHRTVTRTCSIRDVTMRGGTDGVLEVILAKKKGA